MVPSCQNVSNNSARGLSHIYHLCRQIHHIIHLDQHVQMLPLLDPKRLLFFIFYFYQIIKEVNAKIKLLVCFQEDKEEKLQQQEALEVVSFEHFPAESSPDFTVERSTTSTPVTEDRNHAIAVAEATAVAAEAAVAAAQAAARVVRLTGYGSHFKEERAAILIQSQYRGYLVRSFFFFFFSLIHTSLIRLNLECWPKK